MANTAVLVKRFEDLETQLGEVEATKRYEHSEYFAGERVDSEKLLNWQVKARHLLSLACGADSVHLKAFLKCEEPSAYPQQCRPRQPKPVSAAGCHRYDYLCREFPRPVFVM